MLLTLLFCTHQSRALPSGTSSLGAEGLFSHAGLEQAEAVRCFQAPAVSRGHRLGWELQLLPQENCKEKMKDYLTTLLPITLYDLAIRKKMKLMPLHIDRWRHQLFKEMQFNDGAQAAVKQRHQRRLSFL